MVGQKLFTTLPSINVPSRVGTLIDGLPAFPRCCWEGNADKQELYGFEKTRKKAFHDLAFSHYGDS
jgi:hypothetical protein